MAKEKEKKKKKRNAPAEGDDKQVENPKVEKRRKLASEIGELKGLEIYWKLPSADAEERQAAVLALVREVEEAQRGFLASGGNKAEGNPAGKILLGEEHVEKWLSSCAPELQYALPRLVRGVGSSNQCARQGFASALTTIISKIPSVSTDAVLKLIDKEIEVSSSLKGQELRDGLLGRLFAYASIIRAGRLSGDASTPEKQELVKLVADNLLNLALKRSFLREPAISVFLDLVDKLSLKTLQECVLVIPSFSDWLTATPEAGGADVLLLLLKLGEKLPSTVRSKCALASGSFRDLFQSSQLNLLVPYLKESSSSHPRVHLVWSAIAEGFAKLFSDAEKKLSAEHLLLAFWNRVVDDALLDSSHERKYLAMQLVLLFLPKVPSSCIPIILSASFGRCLLDILASPKNLLYTSAQQLLSDLCSWAEQNDDSLVFTIAFFQQTKFDHITKSVIVKDLMSKATSEASCLLAIEKLRDAFVSEGEDDSDDARKLVSSRRLWMIEMMCSFSKQASSVTGSRSGAKEVTRFLAAHLLVENQVVNSKKVAATAPGALLKPVKEACAARLRSLLSERAPRRKAEGEEVEDLGYDLVEFFRPALKKKNAGDLQLKLVDIIVEITSAMKSVESSSRMRAMRGLLSQLLIQLWLEPGSVDEIATDLLICCRKEFGSVLRMSVGDDASDGEGPSVPDVLLDIVLSILSGSPAPIRVASEQLFALYCGEISAAGLSSLLKVISKHIGQTRQESLFEIEDDGEDVISVEDVADDELSGKSDDDEDEEEEVEVKHSNKPGKKAEEARIQGAMDEAELSDMDDEAMFKLDSHLAQILKERKAGGGGDTFTQLLEFKFRVLGLAETYVQKQAENPLVFSIVPTLFQAYLDGNKLLADRIASVLNKLLKAKSYPKGPGVDPAMAKDLVLKLMKLASKTKDERIRVLAQGFVLWLVKVSQAAGGALSDEVLEAIGAGVDEVFSKNKSSLPLGFFQEGVVRFPVLGRVVIGKLVERSKLARTDFEKAEILDVLEAVLKHYKKMASGKGSNPSSSPASFVEPHLQALSEALLLYFAKPLKKHHQVSFLRFCVACVEALRALFPGKPLGKLVDEAGLSAAVAGFQCPEKGKLQTFKAQLEALLKQSSVEEGGRSKNQKRSSDGEAPSKNKKRKK